jgi:hypothetical protein
MVAGRIFQSRDMAIMSTRRLVIYQCEGRGSQRIGTTHTVSVRDRRHKSVVRQVEELIMGARRLAVGILVNMSNMDA